MQTGLMILTGLASFVIVALCFHFALARYKEGLLTICILFISGCIVQIPMVIYLALTHRDWLDSALFSSWFGSVSAVIFVYREMKKP